MIAHPDTVDLGWDIPLLLLVQVEATALLLLYFWGYQSRFDGRYHHVAHGQLNRERLVHSTSPPVCVMTRLNRGILCPSSSHRWVMLHTPRRGSRSMERAASVLR